MSQRAQEVNLEIFNRRVEGWLKMHKLPDLTPEAKHDLITLIEQEANRISVQKVSLASETFSRSFRSSYAQHFKGRQHE